MILLDSTACIDFLKGTEVVRQIIEKNKSNLILTAITNYEINIGLERTKRKVSKKRYSELKRSWESFLKNCLLLPIDKLSAEIAAEIYDKLESEGRIIDDNDCLIAGCMKKNHITKILTRNQKHFARIPGIEVLDYVP